MSKLFSCLKTPLLYLVLFVTPSYSFAQPGDIPDISKCWPISLQISMNTTRDELVKRQSDYNKWNSSFNSRCARNFRTGEEAAYAQCQSELKKLDIESAAIDKAKESYLQLFKDYEKQYHNSNPNIVDGCNVPSGLGQKIDSAIAAEFDKAPQGVSDRVRKGFQAIQIHDWAAAKAWFQDALIRDNDNPGLKRLIDLSEYSNGLKQSAASSKVNGVQYDNLSSQEKNILNVWIHRAREAAKQDIYTDATAGFPESALNKVRKYVYGLSEAERDKLFFPDDFMTELLLYNMMK